MESNIQVAQQATSAADALKQKTRRRIAKLTEDDLADLPGATLTQPKKAEPDFKYSIVFNFPVTSPLGTSKEAADVHDFASQLDIQAKATGVGAVSSVGVVERQFDVVLTLDVTGKQVKRSAPAANAFVQLKDFLDGVALLKQGPSGKPVTYKVKENGTTVADLIL